MEPLLLKIFVENDELRSTYATHITAHNLAVTGEFPNAGFDLLVPDNNCMLVNAEIKKIDHQVKCSAWIDSRPVSYYMYPRSSITKTPLRLANSVGIIDSGYRGNIIAAFDIMCDNNMLMYNVAKHNRLVQLCAPDLRPIIVELVSTVDELSAPTERGEGGFGSTGGVSDSIGGVVTEGVVTEGVREFCV